jgi:polyphosphate:AMP phosphotransferase
MKALAADRDTAWRVTDEERRFVKAFAKRPGIVEDMMRETSTAAAPWTVIDGHDKHWSALHAGRVVLDALTARLAVTAPRPAPEPSLPKTSPPAPNVLTGIARAARIGDAAYERRLAALQARLARGLRRKDFARRGLVIVFEGSDAAGKGGAIRRVSRAIDARLLTIVPIAAPNDEERARPYLGRFWRHVPARGHVTIFDRSWYGRVLVERVEGFCDEADWMRAYHEINEFEEQMVESGAIVLKFWLSITAEEQLKRFREREKVAYKRHKITQEDWRNRKKWPKYERAVCDMIERTSTVHAPWNLVPANDKKFARVMVLQTIADVIEEKL